MKEVLLLKCGEIVLKGLNRKTFEDRLLKNLKRRMAYLWMVSSRLDFVVKW